MIGLLNSIPANDNGSFWGSWQQLDPIATAVLTRKSRHGHVLRCVGYVRCELYLGDELLERGGEGMGERERLMLLAERSAGRKAA